MYIRHIAYDDIRNARRIRSIRSTRRKFNEYAADDTCMIN